MKNIIQFIKEGYSEAKEKEFNNWLEKRYGYKDLYEYYSDLLPDFLQDNKGVNRNNIDKYLDKFIKIIPSSVRKDAEDIGLDPREVAYEVMNDDIMN